jgi:hypothetical protein
MPFLCAIASEDTPPTAKSWEIPSQTKQTKEKEAKKRNVQTTPARGQL